MSVTGRILIYPIGLLLITASLFWSVWGRSLPSCNILFPKYFEIMGDFSLSFGLAMCSSAQPQSSVNVHWRRWYVCLGYLHFQSVISVSYYQQKLGWFFWALVESHCLDQAQLSALTQNYQKPPRKKMADSCELALERLFLPLWIFSSFSPVVLKLFGLRTLLLLKIILKHF